MSTRIQLRRDTAVRWASVNPVLAAGEPAVESDTGKLKVGDGITAWSSLPYILDVSDLTPVLEQLVAAAVPPGVTDENVRDIVGDTVVGDGDFIVVSEDDPANVVRVRPGAALTDLAQTVADTSASLGSKVNSSTYVTGLAGKADQVDGKVPESQLPDRLSDVELRAAFVAGRVLNNNGTVNPQKKLTVKLTADGLDIEDLIIEDVA